MRLPILMIVASEDDGGMARVAALLARHLPAFDVVVRVAVHREAPFTEWLRDAGIAFDVVPELIETPTRRRPSGTSGVAAIAANLAGLPRAAWRIRRLAERHGIGLLYSHNTWSHYVTAAAARLAVHQAPGTRTVAPGTQHAAPSTRLSVVWHIHTDHSRPLTRLMDRAALRLGRVAAVAAVSRSIGQPFAHLSAPLTVVTNGIDREACMRSAGTPRLRSRLGLGRDAVIAVYAGRLVAHKGIHVLMAAAREAVREMPNLHVAILGGSPRHTREDVVATLRAQATDWGVAGRLHLLGHVDEVESYVADADLAVVPSTCADGCPLAAIEALCLGVPVIGSAIGGLPEIVEHDVDGVLVAPGSAPALADAIVRLGRDPDRRVRMSRAAREAARDRFDAVQMSRNVAGVLHAAAMPSCCT